MNFPYIIRQRVRRNRGIVTYTVKSKPEADMGTWKVFWGSMIFAILCALALMALLPSSSFAQEAPIPRCAPYEQHIRYLNQRWGENLYDTQEGEQTGATFELWINTETGTWTLLSRFNKAACVIRAGKIDPAQLQQSLKPKTMGLPV